MNRPSRREWVSGWQLTGPSQIERFNRQRQVTVLANLENKPQGTAIEEIGAVADRVAPDGVETQVSGQSGDLQETIGYMVEALILAIILIFLILAAQFESFLYPLTIMLSFPLSPIGALGALALALSAGGEQRAPMAVAVIGGLVTSTLLTLVIIPVAYDLLDKLAERLGFGAA